MKRFGCSSGTAGTFLAFSAIALWSTNALAAGNALAELGLVQVLALQFGGAAAVISLVRVFGSRGEAFMHTGGWDPLFGIVVGVMGLTGTIFFQYLAFATAPIVEANVVAYGWPLFAALWAALVYRTRRTLAGIPLAFVGFAGVAIILFSGDGVGNDSVLSPGYVAALASAVCMTFYTVAAGSVRTSVYSMMFPATVFGAAVMFAFCVTGTAGWSFSNPSAWAWAIYAGIGPMAGGFFLWSRAMSGDGVERLAPLGYTTPLVSTLILLATGKTFASGAIAGAVLILICSVGVLFMDR